MTMNSQHALKLCRDFLGGGWRNINPSQFQMSPVKGGLSNLLYLCSVPSSVPMGKQDMRQVLIRKHLRIHDKQMEENIIFTVLSEREIGPRLLGVFEGGRLEEFVPSKTLLRQDLWKPSISKLVAAETAILHNTQVPVKKSGCFLVDNMQEYANSVSRIDLDSFSNDHDREIISGLRQNFDFHDEIDLVDGILCKMDSDSLVFCHNDLQENNILVPFKYRHLMFIDYEYGRYNFRAYDIANHFCEWTFDYDVQKSPNFNYLPDHYPTDDEQRLFVDSYFQSMVDNKFLSVRECDVERIGVMEQIPLFATVSHLFWGLWSIVQADISTIPFGYARYAATRLNVYREWKSRYLSPLSNQRQSSK